MLVNLFSVCLSLLVINGQVYKYKSHQNENTQSARWLWIKSTDGYSIPKWWYGKDQCALCWQPSFRSCHLTQKPPWARPADINWWEQAADLPNSTGSLVKLLVEWFLPANRIREHTKKDSTGEDQSSTSPSRGLASAGVCSSWTPRLFSLILSISRQKSSMEALSMEAWELERLNAGDCKDSLESILLILRQREMDFLRKE